MSQETQKYIDPKKQKTQELTERHYKPNYGVASIAEIPHTILDLFDIPTQKEKLSFHNEIKEQDRQYDNVILMVIDGLGWHDFNNYSYDRKHFPLLPNLNNSARFKDITTVFPSRSQPALTTFHTGLTPQEHGILGSNIYIHEVGCMINPSTGQDIRRQTGEKNPIDHTNAKLLFDGHTIYQELKDNNVESFIYSSYGNEENVYRNAIMRPANHIKYNNHNDAVDKLYQNLSKQKQKSYHVFYWKYIDEILHKHGTEEQSYPLAVSHLLNMLQKDLVEKADKRLGDKTLLLISADHGFIDTEDKKFNNGFDYLPQRHNEYIQDRRPRSVMQTGSGRSPILHVKDEFVQAALPEIKDIIKNKAVVFDSREALQLGYFGKGKAKGIDENTQMATSRFGSIILLPLSNNVFLTQDKFTDKGTHGGLSEREMIVPLISTRLSDLK